MMARLTHGGDIYTPRLEQNIEMFDFSSNISPLGIPAGVAAAITEDVNRFSAYPDPLSRELRRALAEFHNIAPACDDDSERSVASACDVDAECIVCGNGAADLIYRIVQNRRPVRALVPAPGFSEYEKALSESGTHIETYELRYPEFAVGADILERISPDIDMIFLCNPNNPTGVLIDRELMKAILKRCESSGTMVVIDECFNEFLDDSAAHSVVGFLDESPHLIVVKAFTKTYAMAGFRLGYILCGSREIAAEIADTGQPWSVSSVAQAAGIQALKETEYVAELRRLIRSERIRLKKELANLGIEVLGGSANYIFFRLGDRLSGGRCENENTGLSDTASRECPLHFDKRMAEKGILIRSCANYRGLDDRYYRIAVKTAKENDLLLQAVDAVLNR